MKPITKSIEYFQDEPMKFSEILDLHMVYGYAHITPDYVIFAYPTAHSMLHITHQGPHFSLKYPDGADTWFIYYACGNLKEAVRLFPYKLPWIAWSYKGRKPRVFRFDRMVNLLAKCSLHEATWRSNMAKATGGHKDPEET